ncbi:MAG: hypothetical protein E6Q67_00790 [Roseateles sp.]|nr:MAG: hypothetical protein E6Q67_00790 [Roseateles sp.]
MSPDQLKSPSDRRFALLLAAEELDGASEAYREKGNDSGAESLGCRAFELRQIAKHELESAQRADKATRFMVELLDSVETLSEIADQHGVGTLSDLLYLQAAILNASFIDVETDSDRSNVVKVLEGLPSGSEWMEFVRLDYMRGPVTGEQVAQRG